MALGLIGIGRDGEAVPTGSEAKSKVSSDFIFLATSSVSSRNIISTALRYPPHSRFAFSQFRHVPGLWSHCANQSWALQHARAFHSDLALPTGLATFGRNASIGHDVVETSGTAGMQFRYVEHVDIW